MVSATQPVPAVKSFGGSIILGQMHIAFHALWLAASLLNSRGSAVGPHSPLPLLQMSWGVVEPTLRAPPRTEYHGSFSDANPASHPPSGA